MHKTLYILALVVFAFHLKGDNSSSNQEILYMFFHQQIESKNLSSCLAQVAKFKPSTFRPIFIAEGFDDHLEKDLIEIADVIEKTLGQCDIFIFDEEGLETLLSFKIKRLPAFAYVAEGKVHTIEGCNVDLTELKKCDD